jgi:hypothetical protein
MIQAMAAMAAAGPLVNAVSRMFTPRTPQVVQPTPVDARNFEARLAAQQVARGEGFSYMTPAEQENYLRGLMGRDVELTLSDGKSLSGKIEGLELADGHPRMKINGVTVELEGIRSVRTLNGAGTLRA